MDTKDREGSIPAKLDGVETIEMFETEWEVHDRGEHDPHVVAVIKEAGEKGLYNLGDFWRLKTATLIYYDEGTAIRKAGMIWRAGKSVKVLMGDYPEFWVCSSAIADIYVGDSYEVIAE